jgi:hypothetical protein
MRAADFAVEIAGRDDVIAHRDGDPVDDVGECGERTEKQE